MERVRLFGAHLASLRPLPVEMVSSHPEDNGLYGIPGTSPSERMKYRLAAKYAEEGRSQQGITVYRPNVFEVTGGNGEKNNIASRYARVDVQGNEAWFEIIGTLDRSKISHISFLTEHPLHLMLGDVNSVDAAKLRAYSDTPREDIALVRLVAQDETPLFTGRERVSDPEELQRAAFQLAEHLIRKPDMQTEEQELSTIEDLQRTDIQRAVAWEQDFQQEFQAANGIIFGHPTEIHATVGNGHSRKLFIYPTQYDDNKAAYVITNELLTQELVPGEEVVARMDSACGCQKFGDRTGGTHPCGHELLASLRTFSHPEALRKPQNTPRILVAWGGEGANGNGDVMQGIKLPALDASGAVLDDEQREFVGRLETEVAKQEHRDFDHLAEVLCAATMQIKTRVLRLQNGNRRKTDAMMRVTQNMRFVSGEKFDMQVSIEPHDETAIPAHIFEAQIADRGDNYDRYRRHAATN